MGFNFYEGLMSILVTALIGVVGYYLQNAYTEFKALLKELTDYTAELSNLITEIQTQISKGIETDISEIKEDVRQLYSKVNQNGSDIAGLSEKVRS